MTEATLQFRACDTTWTVHAQAETSRDAHRAADAARTTVHDLESRLNAFDPASLVSRLYREGRIEDGDVAAIVRRALEYEQRTGGAFDIGHGAFESAIKDHIQGTRATPEPMGRRARYHVVGHVVETNARLDLNGIAKGYIVDAARAELTRHHAHGFVDGGGDIATPTGPVGIEAPDGTGRVVGVLDTRWNVATSGRARRRRGPVDHLYDPRSGRIGSRHDQVTVLARKDCVEADVLATTLAILPLQDGMALARAWPDVEALWMDDDRMWATPGFDRHVWKP